MFLISESVVERIVVIDPIVNAYNAEVLSVIADNNVFDSGVDDHTLAHAAAASVFNVIIGITFLANKIKGGTDHIFSGSADDSVCFCVNASAKFISFSAGNVEFFSAAPAEVAAVFSAAGCAGISG